MACFYICCFPLVHLPSITTGIQHIPSLGFTIPHDHCGRRKTPEFEGCFILTCVNPAYRRTQSLPCEAYGPGPGQDKVSVPFSLNPEQFIPLLPFLASMAALIMAVIILTNFCDGSIDGSIDSINSMNSSFVGSEKKS